MYTEYLTSHWPLSRLTYLHEYILKLRAPRNLLSFAKYTKADYWPNWHHDLLAQTLDRVAAGRCRRLMVFMPPQHGKSELVSRRFPAYLLGCNPNLRLIAASHTHELAVALNRDVQRLIASRSYFDVFPRTQLAGGKFMHRPGQARIHVQRKLDYFELLGHRGSLRSAGVGQSIAGLPADGAIIDDPFGKREDADSPVIRQKIWDWYANDLYTRLSADAWIVLTHTRWHRDDLAGRLLRKMADRAAEQWEVLCLPAIRGETPPIGNAVSGHNGTYGTNGTNEPSHIGPMSLIGPITPMKSSRDTRQPGQALWPEFKSREDLEIIRRQDARAFAALYQQDPAEATLAEWPPECFGDWIWLPPEKWPREFKLRVVCLDASKGGRDRPGDYSAIVFLGVGRDNLIYVDAVLDRIPLNQIVHKLIVFCDKYRPNYVGIEAEQFQELLVHEFRRQCGENFCLRLPVWKMFTHGQSKVGRIRGLSHYINNRELRFRADSPGCRLLVDQLMDFPLAEHDDGPDALEMCVRLPIEVKRLQ
jgi:predicted phage terminase large subunit-like protein